MKTPADCSPPPVLRRVILRTTDAARLAEFYAKTLGLGALEGISAGPGLALRHPVTGAVLLTLLEDKAARPAPSGAPGLFHLAFLFPELADWSEAVKRSFAAEGLFHGASDHGVSWAVYLEDPDGNGLELAWDKPAGEWPWHGDSIAMVSRALPLRSILLNSAAGGEYPGKFGIGHLHLQVDDLAQAQTFARELELRVTQSDYPGALFLARGRYHHHLAVNTWRTGSGVRRPGNCTGLAGWEMTLEHAATPSEWQSPDGSLVTRVAAARTNNG